MKNLKSIAFAVLLIAGTGEYLVTISYSFCRDGTGGVCRFGKAKYKLPLTATAEGTSEVVELSIKEE